MDRVCAYSQQQAGEFRREPLASDSMGPPLNILVSKCRAVDRTVPVIDNIQEVINKSICTRKRLAVERQHCGTPVIDLGGMACMIFLTASDVVASAGESFREQPFHNTISKVQWFYDADIHLQLHRLCSAHGRACSPKLLSRLLALLGRCSALCVAIQSNLESSSFAHDLR